MTKLVLAIFSLLATAIQTASQTTIYKEWVGEDLEYLKLTRKKASYDHRYRLDDFKVRYRDSSLTLIDNYWQFGKFFFIRRDFLKFKISRLTKDTLIIEAVNENAKRITDKKTSCTFIDKNAFRKPDFFFQKICFYGWINDSIAKIEIDSTGLIHFWGKPGKTVPAGQYRANLSGSQLKTFLEILNRCEVYRLLPDRFLIHSPQYYVRFYYNNTYKTSSDIVLHHNCKELLQFLYSLPKDIKLDKSGEEYKFEKIY